MPVQGLLFNGAIDFGRSANNPLDTNYAYANAALGVFNSYSEASARPTMRARALISEFFVQDNWKAHRRLTLDYGVRLYLVPPICGSGQSNDRVCARAIRPLETGTPYRPGDGWVVNEWCVSPVDGTRYPAALIGAIAPGSGDSANGMVLASRDTSYPRALTANPGLKLAPRIGFAYDVFGRRQDGHPRRIRCVLQPREYGGSIQVARRPQPPLVNTPVVNFSQLSTLRSSAGLLFPSIRACARSQQQAATDHELQLLGAARFRPRDAGWTWATLAPWGAIWCGGGRST